MASWWKKLGLVLASLAIVLSPAAAQPPTPPPEGGGPPGAGKESHDPLTLPNDGTPNAFSDLFGIRARSIGIHQPGHRLLPGFLVRRPSPGLAADFPNCAVPSTEDASPFTVQEGGQPNGFTELCDPNPHPLLSRLGARRLLHTEFLTGPSAAPPYRIAFRYEYLLWNISDTGPSVPLVTSSRNPAVERGLLTQPNTIILVPASTNSIDYGTLNSYRLVTGIAIGYLPPLEIGIYSMGRNVLVFSGGSTDATGPLLARPVQYLNVPVAPGVGTEAVEAVNIPGVLAGSINVQSRVNFLNLDANFFFNAVDGDSWRLDGILGYRHTGLYETLDINSISGGKVGQVRFGGALLPPGFQVAVQDSFHTQNTFDGGQLGFRSVLSAGRFSFFTDAVLGVGVNQQHSVITGSTTLIQPVQGRPTQTLAGGVLALQSNSGTLGHSIISFIPEANLSLSYQLHPNIRLLGGYNVTYWTNVQRPGDQLNNVVDSRRIPSNAAFNNNVNGLSPPFPQPVQRDFFAHGFFFGFELGY